MFLQEKNTYIYCMVLRVREILKRRGMTNGDLAEIMGMHINSIQRMATSTPTVKTVLAMAKALDIDIRDMFYPTKDLNPMEKLEKAAQLIEEARAELGKGE